MNRDDVSRESRLIDKLTGDRQFYRKVFIIAIPIMIQNGITNFVALLDNIMVGQVGTEQMSGVAIINQLFFVFNVSIFGGISGAGIFGAQYFGSGDHKGLRDTFRLKLILCGFLCIVAFLLFFFMDGELINLYLHGDISTSALETIRFAKAYLRIMLFGLIPFALIQAYTSTLRETGETVLPMVAGICAVLVNLCFNYMLIFGKFGFPALGVEGAAIATVIARFVEMGIIVMWTHVHTVKNKFIVGAWNSFLVPAHLVRQVLVKGSPLIVNEILWSCGQAVLLQCYALRGLSVIAGFNISSTIANVFNIAFIALGGAISVIIGQLLGAGKMKEAKDTAWKLIAFSVVCCIIMSGLMSVCAPFFPEIYNTNAEIRSLATKFIWVAAGTMPLHAFMNSAYFTLRSGGKTMITFLFDSGFAWVVSIPLAYLLSRFTNLPIVSVYLICSLSDIFKCLLGFILLKKGVWIQNIIHNEKEVS